MNHLRTYEGYIYKNIGKLPFQKQDGYLDFIFFLDKENEEYYIIPCGSGINAGPWQTVENIHDFLTDNNYPKEIIDIAKAGTPVRVIIDELNIALKKSNIIVSVLDLEDLKKKFNRISVISMPSGELIEVSVRHLPELIKTKLITYGKKVWRYICYDSKKEKLKEYYK